MFQRDTFIHLVSGGIAGTAGAVVTCPLEVVKTRLQSSNPTFGNPGSSNSSSSNKSIGSSGNYSSVTGRPGSRNLSTCVSCGRSASILSVAHHSTPPAPAPITPRIGLGECLRLIYKKEGPQALFKGLGPNLVGVAPSRAIYFCSYSQAKKTFNQIFPTEAPIVHICSAATAGFVACTVTNPVWFVKTRLQLDQQHRLTTRETIRRIYAKNGILGFYKGITASYMGISETVIHFVIYEAVKKRLQDWSMSNRTLRDEDYDSDNKTFSDFVQFMAAGAISKTTASCIAYPHEVARTRLREEGSKYRSFWQTLALVCKEEGYRGMYRGLVTQLVRQIPNTAIMMSTYEASVYLLNKYLPDKSSLRNENELTGVEALNRLPGEDYDDTTFTYEVPTAHPEEPSSQVLTT